ncbi:MAG: glycosyltransferase [Geminicoccaceae bacterium]|nr:MAG: glycosyltransferase [Geminicoccaceae bacterium]
MLEVSAFACLAAWLVLLFARDGFWRQDQRLGEREPSRTPPVIAIVPARNEAATVVACLEALSAQDYPGELTVLLVDDGSDDATNELARGVAERSLRPIRVLAAPPKPPGWSGKIAAQEAGLDALEGLSPAPSWLWLTDADIVHGPDVLRRLVGEALARRVDLASTMVRLSTRNAVERWLAPAFVYFFQLLYPFRAVNDPARGVAAAAGGCILVDHAKLRAAGGFAPIADQLIDDIALARLIRARGGRLWLGLNHASHSVRGYDFGAFANMVARTAFTELRHSYPRLVISLLGLSLVFVAPWALLVLADEAGRLAALAACVLMLWSYVPTVRAYGLPQLWVATLPVAAVAYMGMTLLSAWRHARGAGAAWRGRTYAG